jgi:hypothetical protein
MFGIDDRTIEALAIAIPVWLGTAIVGAVYISAANRVLRYLEDFHGPAWDRLQSRFVLLRKAGRNAYYRPRKRFALLEVIWCWRSTLRHVELDKLTRTGRRLGVAAVVGIVASAMVGALFDR